MGLGVTGGRDAGHDMEWRGGGFFSFFALMDRQRRLDVFEYQDIRSQVLWMIMTRNGITSRSFTHSDLHFGCYLYSDSEGHHKQSSKIQEIARPLGLSHMLI